jgi:hypothetical protein
VQRRALVLVLVETLGKLIGHICSQRLEGSRFGAYQTPSRYSSQRSIRPKNVATGGSRESPSATHLTNRGFRFVSIHPVELQAAGSGSRLVPQVPVGFVIERIREGDETRAKAAPLQAPGGYKR